MGRAVFRTLIWTAAAGLLLTAILPPGHDRAASDHPARTVDARDTLRAAPSPSAPNGVVRAASVDGPALMHRKHQDDASGDRVDLLPNANAAAAIDVDAALVAGGIPAAIACGDAPGRNRPLRL